MREMSCLCCICESEADWVRARMPNKEQMTYLCHRHYQALQQNNPILAGYYDDLTSLPPMAMQPASQSQLKPDPSRLG